MSVETITGTELGGRPPGQEPPGEEPPPEVTTELLWRLAARLFREHQPDRSRPNGPNVVCAGCRQPWPCSGLRMAELGLSAAKGGAVRLESIRGPWTPLDSPRRISGDR